MKTPLTPFVGLTPYCLSASRVLCGGAWSRSAGRPLPHRTLRARAGRGGSDGWVGGGYALRSGNIAADTDPGTPRPTDAAE